MSTLRERLGFIRRNGYKPCKRFVEWRMSVMGTPATALLIRRDGRVRLAFAYQLRARRG